MNDRRARETAGSAPMALGVAVIVWLAVLARISQEDPVSSLATAPTTVDAGQLREEVQ